MKPSTKLILSAISGLLVIGFIVLWDLVIVPSIDSEEVVVVKPNVVIHKFDDIKQSDLTIEKRNRGSLIEGYIKPEDIKTIVGKQAAQNLVGNQIISTRFVDLDNSEPNPEKGESIRPIPNQWIYALPATLRRKDTIDIYLVKSDSLKENQSSIRQTTSSEEFIGLSPEQELANKETEENAKAEDKNYEEQRIAITEDKKFEYKTAVVLGEKQEVLDYQAERQVWLETKGLNEDQWKQLAVRGDIPVLVDVPVAYAKDGTGNEIQNNVPEENANQKEESRLRSTGTITNLELLLNEEKHRLLMNYINEGYQLYITYN